MKSVITTVLLIGLAVSAVGYFMYDEMWGNGKDKYAETKRVIDQTEIPRS